MRRCRSPIMPSPPRICESPLCTASLGLLGEVRAEFVIGKLGGQQYTWRPWFNAQKLSFKLTDNLEMGFTRWSIFWGVGHPMTLGSFIDNFTTLNAGVPAAPTPAIAKADSISATASPAYATG